jgi:hypothetical protein
VAHDREYPTHQDVVESPNIVAEITHLKATRLVQLHLTRAPFSETCYQISMSREIIGWIRVSRVTYTRYYGDHTDEHRGHLYRVELPYYSLHRRVVILYHVGPVTPPILALANLVKSLAIHPVKPTCGQIGNRPYKTCQSKCKEGEQSKSTTIHQVRTWSY